MTFFFKIIILCGKRSTRFPFNVAGKVRSMRIQCPICNQEQVFADGKLFMFCENCGAKLILPSEVARQTLSDAPENPESERPAEETEGTEELWTEDDKKEEPEGRSGRGLIFAILCAVLLLGLALGAYFVWIKPAFSYRAAVLKMQNRQYEEAIADFESLGAYSDSKKMKSRCLVEMAVESLGGGRLEDSAALFRQAEAGGEDFNYYVSAVSNYIKGFLQSGNYDAAADALEKLPYEAIGDMGEGIEGLLSRMLEEGNYPVAAEAWDRLRPYEAHPDKVSALVNAKAASLLKEGDYRQAAGLFGCFPNIPASVDKEAKDAFDKLMQEENHADAADFYASLKPYLSNTDNFEKTVEEAFYDYLDGEKDTEALALCNAFIQSMDTGALLKEGILEKMSLCMEEENWERVSSLFMSYYKRVEDMDEPLLEKAQSLIEDQKYEAITELLGNISAEDETVSELHYKIGVMLLDAKEYEQASAVFESLGDFEDSADMVKEVVYRQAAEAAEGGDNARAKELFRSIEDYSDAGEKWKSIQYQQGLALLEISPMSPENLTDAYKYFSELRSYEDSMDRVDEVLLRWADAVIQTGNQKAYLSALTAIGVVSAGSRAKITRYVLEKTPLMAGKNEDGNAWLSKDSWMQYNVRRFLELNGDNSDVCRSFIQYLLFLEGEIASLSQADAWNLWDVRADVKALCTSNNFLLFFLWGKWTQAGGSGTLEVVKTNSVYSVKYGLPMSASAGQIRVSRGGLTLYDEVGREITRLCDIKIIGIKTVELVNKADGRTYTLTRP